jgi:hypothetical protein
MRLPDRAVVPEGVRALARRWLGSGIDISRATSGGSTLVYRIGRGTETFWLRLAEDAGEDRSAEWEVHRRLVAAGARVPAVVAAEVAPPELDRSVCLTTHTPGVPLLACRDPAIARQVATAAGGDLALVNAVDMRGFGFADSLDRITCEIVAMYTTRAEWTAEIDRALAKVTDQRLLPGSLLPELERVVAGYRRSGSETIAHAAHGDFDASHIYHDPDTGAYTGIIDFGELMGADREWDPGHALAHDGQGNTPPIADALIAGWGEADVDRMRACAVIVALRRFARHHATPYGAFLATKLGELLTMDR